MARLPTRPRDARIRRARILVRVIGAVYLAGAVAGFVVGYNLGAGHSRSAMYVHGLVGLLIGAFAAGILGHIAIVVIGASLAVRRMHKSDGGPPS
jgi:hypothetical protein